MKDYYRILRLPRSASHADVRRAYRRLAVAFHPDKNHSPQAISLFQEINEAHEVLSDPQKRAAYDQLLSEPVATPETSVPWHRDPAYRRKHTPGYRPRQAGPSEQLLMMLHFLRYMRWVAGVGLFWCGVLALDYVLPPKINDEKVVNESNRKISWEFHHTPHVVVTEKAHQFPVSLAGAKHFPEGSTARVITSRLLNVLIRVDAVPGPYSIDSLATVYSTFLMIPVTLLILSIGGLMIKSGIEFRFNVEVAICILLFFNFIFLMFSIL